MKIGLLTFPIGKVGGIITNVTNLEKGFKTLGHDVAKYFVSTNTSKLPTSNDFGWEVLGYEKPEWYEHYKQVVNTLDLIIWVVCCPHLLKSYTSETWKKCYEVKPQQMAYIHDNYYKKYYPWFEEMPIKHGIRMICPYEYMYESIDTLKAMKRVIDNPIDFDETGLYNEHKENVVVDHNNWKGIKHKEILIRSANKIEGNIIVYGDKGTLEYSQIKNSLGLPNIKDLGWGTTKEVYSNLKRAKVVTDFCKRGGVSSIYDYTITEAIAHGCIPLLLSNICVYHKHIGVEYIDSTLELKKITCHNEINKIFKNFNQYSDIREKNLKAISFMRSETIAQKVLDYSKEPYQEVKPKNSLLKYL